MPWNICQFGSEELIDLLDVIPCNGHVGVAVRDRDAEKIFGCRVKRWGRICDGRYEDGEDEL